MPDTICDRAASQTPWIRPGVVVHDPAELVDDLLAEFALGLRARGFNVGGYVQHNNRGNTGKGQGCAPQIEYLDISTATNRTIEREAAADYLRRAMREEADLLVISHFYACIGATDSVGASLDPQGTRGMPLLTSIAGQCIHKWHSYARRDGSMIAPDLASLWSWWGPEQLYRDLALGVSEHDVRGIVCGPRWIMVEGPEGGLAPLPRHPRACCPGCRAWPGKACGPSRRCRGRGTRWKWRSASPPSTPIIIVSISPGRLATGSRRFAS